MRLFVPKENQEAELRVPLMPDDARKLAALELEVVVEQGLGQPVGFADKAYEDGGAKVATDRAAALAEADVVLRLNKPPAAEIAQMRQGALHISHLDPFREDALVDAFAEHKIDAIAMEMIPRTTLAQKMDALSSQANLAGYVAVILAAQQLPMVFPMMMTPSGTLKPSRVFIIGCGVAGLQAIATAKRLGSRVDAFDTRPVVEEQVQSLGAKFVKVDLGEMGQTEQGYAKELTEEQRQKQVEAMAKVVAQSDVVITTAQVFGRKAPVIVTDEMVRSMRPGSIVVDCAIETGGNVEPSRLDEEVDVAGVKVLGYSNLPGRVALHASQMYSANVLNLITHFWDKEGKTLKRDTEDEIMDGCLIVQDGALRSEMIRKAREAR